MRRLLSAATLLVAASSATALAQTNNQLDPPTIVTQGARL